MGQKVATIVDGYRQAGSHTVVWNGASDAGIQAASGIYLCRMRSGDFEEAIKMVLAK
jgi:hypothetical protein